MGSIEAEHRHREHLPVLGFFGKDGPNYTAKHPSAAIGPTSSPTPLLSPTAMYPSQSLPYSFSTSASTVSLQGGYISPPDSRRALEEEKEKPPQRQSLPSIHEALGNDNPLPYPAPTSAPPQQAHHAPHPHPLSSNVVGRPGTEGPPGPPNPFSNGASTGTFMRESTFPHQPQLQAEVSRSSLASINTQDSRPTSLQSLSSGKSPTQSAKTGLTSISGSQTGSGYEYSAPPSAGSVTSPHGYGTFSQSFQFQSQAPLNAPSYPSTPYDTRPYVGPGWKPGMPEAARADEMKGVLSARPPLAGQHHGDHVKRHLDIYDVETSLNEIAEISTRSLDFSRHYAARAHQTQRSGPVMGSLPSLHEIEEILNLQRRNQDALIRIRTAVLNQEHALAEQMAQRKAFKAGGMHGDDHVAMYQEDYKGNGGFAGADSKKRRGKAAPPGRCHSCNRAETPEWRRGPDGARTLCNACGLHYAKLTRKMGANKAASMGSNLRPKTALDTSSPSSH
ncbi:GATA-type sexual development transcription factor NsdD [Aspergillus homomorphus CBS 101889]|uniref:Sexual development transcription factor NsdD n=1 Tax=Aspergillus homomorphus (strain CBS 101889) TaxID=1450537 RepID=A0A395HTY2_ASPHC|nr:sexual development transcription factor NsdD [Aspergillus homomorphus CBS 101889]RAL11250.1 sexual development transcription factor NsdD [Aspergillus homomorphus CBS 101889]